MVNFAFDELKVVKKILRKVTDKQFKRLVEFDYLQIL